MKATTRFLATVCVYLALVSIGRAASIGHAAAVKDLPGLTDISIFERSSAAAPTEFVFGVNSTEMTTLLPDPLSAVNRDFIGTTFGADENYDVFYSDADGTFNLDGSFITVSADYDFSGDSGLNLAGVRLNFVSGPGEFANSVASFVALGTTPLPATVGNAVDGDINTHTFMGDTAGQTTQRLSVTVGFESTVIPEPSSFAIAVLGLIGLFGTRSRFPSGVVDTTEKTT